MVTHGKGPKIALVWSHRRWRLGRFQWVKTFTRGVGHKLGYRQTAEQLRFGFDQKAPGA